jgi:hypothetical protein
MEWEEERWKDRGKERACSSLEPRSIIKSV